MVRRGVISSILLVAACGGGDDGDAAPPDAGCAGEDPSECPSQAACDRGECLDIPFFYCVNGRWEEVICEGGVSVDPVGTWTLTQTITDTTGTCPDLVPRDPLVLTVDVNLTVTAEPPIVITASNAAPNWGIASLTATLTDDWQGVTPTIDYALSVDEFAAVTGTGTLTVDQCTATLAVTGTRTPP